jgi:ribosome biogenesis GTPase A
MITELRLHRQRPCLKILNKADLADPLITQAWLNFYNRQAGVKAVALSCKNASDAARVPSLCQPLAPHRDSTFKPLRMMIMGIPNVGKSTLMNMLLKRRVANVGDEPAVTKSQQCHQLNDHMTLTDSPGLLWPKIEKPEDGLKLATIHAIGRNAVIEEEVAEFLAATLLSRYPGLLAARYDVVEKGMDGVGVIEAIAKKRGCLLKGRGGELDLEKSAMIFLTEYRSGKLGRISLETPGADKSGLEFSGKQPVSS